MHDRNPTGFRSTGRMTEKNIARGLLSCSSWERGISMTESLHEFLRWGPYGLYATFALMVCAIPLGWLYAYVACVGKRRDITEPNSERQKAAMGGADHNRPGYFPSATHLGVRHSRIPSRHSCTGLNGVDPILRHPSQSGDSFRRTLAPPLRSIAREPRSHHSGPGRIHHQGVGAPCLEWWPSSWVVQRPWSPAFVLCRLLGGGPVVPTGVPLRRPDRSLLSLRPPPTPGHLSARHPRGTVADYAELVLALSKGTLDKTDWQSKIMAYKSRKIEGGLNENMERIQPRKVRITA